MPGKMRFVSSAGANCRCWMQSVSYVRKVDGLAKGAASDRSSHDDED